VGAVGAGRARMLRTTSSGSAEVSV
jgi:hypothetical protein